MSLPRRVVIVATKRPARRLVVALAIAALATPSMDVAPAAAQQVTLTAESVGTTSIEAATRAPGAPSVEPPEFLGLIDESVDAEHEADPVNRSPAAGTARGRSVNAGKKAKSNPELLLSFAGINHRDQRTANNGNQLNIDPPDQALCVGNGFVLESVNSALRIFDASGNPLSSVIDLNTFYGYPPTINRQPGAGNARGPLLTDPGCHFDSATQRFFHVILTLETVPTIPAGAFSGRNHLDLAVSNTPDPRGTWTIYRIPTQNDGTEGTPDHGCSPAAGGAPATRTNPRACIADFPRLGVDRNGVYVTVNEFDFFGPNFHHANIYAISKAQLVSTPPSLDVTLLSTEDAVDGEDGFTVWPATTPGNQFSDDAGGTEYFLSSRAVLAADSTSTSLVVWALTNTSSLNSTPALNLSHVLVTVDEYGVPHRSVQKPGNIPLAECINDTIRPITPTLRGCWRIILPTEPMHTAALGQLDSSDSRILTVMYANGKLWGALATAVMVGGENRAGIGWYILKPRASASGISATLAMQGVLALENNNLTYPAIGVTPSGRGVIAFTLVGEDNHPSAAYAPIDALVGAGDIHIAAEGAGPDDSFSKYIAFSNRPRWGDYAMAAVDGRTVWIASEFVGQTCTFDEYFASAGSCGGTRTALANWGTRISKLVP